MERGIADAYAEHFKMMASNYPNAWWVCCMAEWEFRYEFAVEERARQREFHSLSPTLSRYDPERPWNSVLLAGIKGVDAMQFWENSLKEKARNWQATHRAQTHPSWCNRQANLYSPLGAANTFSGGQPPASTPPGMGRRALKRKAAAEAASSTGRSQPGKPGPKAQASDAGQRRPDGRYLKAENQVELCYAWGRSADGCATECLARPPRVHACEWCRGSHRSIDCPVHPNWKPEFGKKGEGKGKRKHL